MDLTFATDQKPSVGHVYPFVGDFAVQEIPTGAVLIAGNFSSIIFRNQQPAPQNYGPLLWLNNNGVTDRSIIYSSLGYVKKITLMNDNNFFVAGAAPACGLFKNSGVQDTSYTLEFPKGKALDIVKESDSSIIVLGSLLLTNSLSPTTGLVKIIKR